VDQLRLLLKYGVKDLVTVEMNRIKLLLP